MVFACTCTSLGIRGESASTQGTAQVITSRTNIVRPTTTIPTSFAKLENSKYGNKIPEQVWVSEELIPLQETPVW